MRCAPKCARRWSRPEFIAGVEGVRDDFAHETWQRFACELCERNPARPARCRYLPRDVRHIDRKLERKMREDMTHTAGAAAPRDPLAAQG